MGHAGTAGRIGPNAITRVAEVLPQVIGEVGSLKLFELAGLAHYLQQPPQDMVDEAEVTRLHWQLQQSLGSDVTRIVARQAGLRTANYLLQFRIPKPVQALLKVLPARLASRVLLSAIRGHAWTFSGSGVFTAKAGQPVVLRIRDNPMCRGITTAEPSCDFYAATFEHLFQVLVHHQAKVTEVECESSGGSECRFEVRW
jgi:divinyl protochlorophyllide a 8-vinyl-reductase